MDYEGLPGVLLDKISIPIWSDFNIDSFVFILSFFEISIPIWSDFNRNKPSKYVLEGLISIPI